MSNSSLCDFRRIKTKECNIPRNKPITKITIHHAAGIISAKNLNDWGYTNGINSWHYSVGSDGLIGQLIDEGNRPWTSSSGANDHQAITMEVGNSTTAPNWEISSASWNKMIDLCVDIIKRNNGIKRKDGKPGLYFDNTPNGSLTFHDMFTNKVCPGPYIRSRVQLIVDQVNAKLDGKPVPVVDPNNPIYPGVWLRVGTKGNDVGIMQTFLNKVGTKNTSIPKLSVDGDFGKLTEDAVIAFQKVFKLSPVDGIIGPGTWGAIVKEYNMIISTPAPAPAPAPPTHWAKQHYDSLVKKGIISGDATSKVWTNYDGKLSDVSIGQFLAMIDKSSNYKQQVN